MSRFTPTESKATAATALEPYGEHRFGQLCGVVFYANLQPARRWGGFAKIQVQRAKPTCPRQAGGG